MSVDNRRSVVEILTLNQNVPQDWEVIDKEYKAVDIDKIKIDGNTYTNYGAYSFIWEISYVTPPKRSSGGVINDLNSHAVIITGHLVIDYSIISIDDWRSIFRGQLERREFTVECYDPIYNEKTKLKMYFATEQMPKFRQINKRIFNSTRDEWEDYIMLYGVGDYHLELIGTNSDLDLVSVIYHLNPPADTGVTDEQVGEPDVYKGEDVLIGQSVDFQDETFGGRYIFKCWNISPSGGDKGNYLDGYAYTINTNLVLYAIWESSEQKTLSYSYGLSSPMIDTTKNEYVYSKNVLFNQSIGDLPTFDTSPSVKYEDTDYFPYENGAWYKTPQKTPNSVPVKSGDLYWSNFNSQIYLLYDTKKYKAIYYLDGAVYLDTDIEYGGSIMLPKLVKDGYTFSGWYIDSAYTKTAPTNMPPYPINLYARFIKK